ncbi:MAG: hypothetical protein ACJ8G5_09305 [Burkholderiales bacterium]
MPELKNDRLFVAGGGLIFQCMKKALFQLPTAEELYALEKRARRERSMHVAALFRSLVSSLYERVRSALIAKVVRHA